ncbi:MAG TPA: hypothetical protein ENJ57_05220 [Rhizobiales bacterium]|nr:hypothetical protein [Hyphomicrobiales bacterium]
MRLQIILENQPLIPGTTPLSKAGEPFFAVFIESNAIQAKYICDSAPVSHKNEQDSLRESSSLMAVKMIVPGLQNNDFP